MTAPVKELLERYDASAPLAEAWTIPAPFYLDPRIYGIERRTVFSRSFQLVGRADQVREPGQYFTCEIGGEPVVVVRGDDDVLRGFFNVCRHHAAAVMTEPCGKQRSLRCPYHGWTYSLSGELKGTPDFAGAACFDRASFGLLPVEVAVFEGFVFVRLTPSAESLEELLGEGLVQGLRALRLGELHWMERRTYTLYCNWKVFVDNYLDGGYHVPHLHKGLDSVLDYQSYAIELGERWCLQSSPVVSERAERETGAVRTGERALYYWIYPNLMVNWYEGVMDTNVVIPRGEGLTDVVFDFYFADVSAAARAKNLASIAVSERIQEEDVAVCQSVQRGLASRAYTAGRLSPRREAGEHLFHKLLHVDVTSEDPTGLKGR